MSITHEMYDVAGRKYIDIDSGRFKIPYRYNRVMCKVHGLIPVQDMKVGDKVAYEYKVVSWEGQHHKVLSSIEKKS